MLSGVTSSSVPSSPVFAPESEVSGSAGVVVAWPSLSRALSPRRAAGGEELGQVLILGVVMKFPWVVFPWVAPSPLCSDDVVVGATMESLARVSAIAQLGSAPAVLVVFP
jgi:hypothetical protein